MKNILLVVIFSFILIVANAQFKQNIRGVILDSESKVSLPGANVAILVGDKTIGTISNERGEFELMRIPIGSYSLTVSYMGYEPYLMRNLELTSGKEKIVNIELTEQVHKVDEILIQAYKNGETRNQMAALSARSFSVKETERYAGSWGDPSRMAANFAGVITANDSRNDIIIRGNSPQGLLWRLEGVSIPNPNHFGALGSTGGPVSILNNNLLSNSDFFTGAFPAEYGNALSGVFDLKMRNGNNRRHEFVGQIGFNGFEAGLEGPISKKAGSSYMVNYRYSVLGLMNKLGFSATGSGVPEYQDLTLRINVPTKKLGTFSLFSIAGNSQIEFNETGNESGSYDIVGNARTQNGSKLGVVGLTHRFFPDSRSNVYTAFSASYQGVATKIDTVFENQNNKIFFGENNAETRLSGSSKYTLKINARNTLKAGVEFQRFGINYIDSISGEVFDPPVDGYINQLNTDEKNLDFWEGFGEWQHRIDEHLTFYGGLHSQYFFYNSTYSFDPRLSLSYQINSRSKVSLAYGKHAQLQPFYVYFTENYDFDTHQYLQTNNKLDFSQAHHIVGGFDHSFTENLKLKLESYYQFVYNVPVGSDASIFSMVNAGNSFHQDKVDHLVNDGQARNYGLEITLEKYLANNYYFLVTTSLFESKYRASDLVWRNTEFNTNYVVNALGGYQISLGEKSSIDINMRVVSSGGKRNLFIDLDNSIAKGYTVYDDSKAYTERGTPYFRLDGRAAFKMNGKKITQEWALDLTNITGHQNVFSTAYNNTTREIENVYQQGFFPMFLYRITF
ncbi:MAG: carboxypeptidase-like regulatory domain-containing protein [Prolixibacteraceae bacterium]